MTHAELREHIREFVKGSVGTLLAKNADYAPDADALAGFKKVAQEMGLTPLQVWGVYVMKHWHAVQKSLRGGELKDEAIESRLQDIANYMAFGAILFKEAKAVKTPAIEAEASQVPFPEPVQIDPNLPEADEDIPDPMSILFGRH